MKLYELTNEYENLFETLNNVDEITSEVIENTLMPIKQDIKNKSINIASYIKNLECEMDAMDDYINKMTRKKKIRQKKIDAIKNYLRTNMEKTGINKIETTEFTILLGSEDIRTEIYDSSVLPINLCRRVEKFEPDKNLIKKAIEDGNIIDGARLIKTRRLTIK